MMMLGRTFLSVDGIVRVTIPWSCQLVGISKSRSLSTNFPMEYSFEVTSCRYKKARKYLEFPDDLERLTRPFRAAKGFFSLEIVLARSGPPWRTRRSNPGNDI